MAERQGNGGSTLPSGVYRHKETGQEIIATETEKFGNPQADAYVRLGYEYVGEVTSKAGKEAVDALADPSAAPIATPQGVKSVAQLEAELAEAKAREAEAREKTKEVKAEEKSEAPKEEKKGK